jgi:hypothetical protein
VHAVFARLEERFGTLDAEAFDIVAAIYRDGWPMFMSAFFDKEEDKSNTLIANGMAYTDAQKFVCFPSISKNRAVVMRVLALFEDANPDDAGRAWPRLKLLMLAQDQKNSRGTDIVRTEIYPQAHAATAEPAPECGKHEEDQDHLDMSATRATADEIAAAMAQGH